jgi:hypothetical protein
MKIIRKQKHKTKRERVFSLIVGILGLFRGLVETLSLGYLTTDLYEEVLFSETLQDWVDGNL